VNAEIPNIPAFLDRRPLVASYSLLHCFRDICPHQGQARYIDKSIKFVETLQIKEGNAGHTAFEQRVGGGKPLPLDLQQYEAFAQPFDGRGALVETWFYVDVNGRACDRYAKDKFLHGKIDVALVDGENAFINDWKFGNSKYEDPFELEVCAVLLNAKYPSLRRIKGTYSWIRDGRVSQVYDLSNTAATWREICRVMSQILAWKAAGEFPKKQSGLCSWCQRYDCNLNTNPEKPA
jgi:hypothetical protein